MEYRNINSFLVNSTKVMMLGRLLRSRLPRISDKVVLKINDRCRMIVEVSWISHDSTMFRGKVAACDVHSGDERAHIIVGELVEFSLEKIAEVPTKIRRFPWKGQ